MSFCEKCGTSLNEGSAFCPSCGAPISGGVGETEKQTENTVSEKVLMVESEDNPVNMTEVKKVSNTDMETTEPSKTEAKPKKKVKVWLIAIIAVAASLFLILFIIIALVLFLVRKPTINLNKYVTVNFTGYEGMGQGNIYFDTDKLEKDYGGKIIPKQGGLPDYELEAYLNGYSDADIPLMVLYDEVGCSLDPNGTLSNGDKVTLKWNVSEKSIQNKIRVKLKYKEETFVVSGLKDIQKFDPFDSVNVEFVGISPCGELKITQTDEKSYYINYSVSTDGKLKNGDVVTVTADPYYTMDQFAQTFGCIPSVTEKQFTVQGLDEYVQTASEIDDNTLTKINKQAQDVIETSVSASGYNVELNSADYIGNYFLYCKDPNSIGWGNAINALFMIYKVDVSGEVANNATGKMETVQFEYYYYLCYRDIVNEAEGGIFIDPMNYSVPYSTWGGECDIPYGAIAGIYHSFYFTGYAELDSVYQEVIINNKELYSYEDNINQTLAQKTKENTILN